MSIEFQGFVDSLDVGEPIDIFNQIVEVLGYSNQDEFLMDNSGAIDAMINWVSKQDCPEWRQLFEDNTFVEDDEDFEDDDLINNE